MNKMGRKVLIYNHGGSGNHGCEALARTVISLLNESDEIDLMSEEPEQDRLYGLSSFCNIIPARLPESRKSFSFIRAYTALKLKKDYFEMDFLDYRKAISELKQYDLAISIGGDVYCYDYYPLYIKIHRQIRKHAGKTVLLGCSLEKSLFDDPDFMEDINSYDLITARESLTYEYLKNAGVKNVELIPDTAFSLQKKDTEYPSGFLPGNTVGINLSPLVIEKECRKGILIENYVSLIRYILNETEMNVALIPHVVWNSNDDRKALEMLAEHFGSSGRIVLIDDRSCMELKKIISECRFLVGARTHATIAAYSSCVPTLVVGYSIKSKGIAVDLFDTAEQYVVPVPSIINPDDLLNGFKWMYANEESIRGNLKRMMPEYIERVSRLKELL